MRYISNPVGLIELLTLPYIEWVNIQMLVTENTEFFSFVGAASAANSSRSYGLFSAEAAPRSLQYRTNQQNKHFPLCHCGKFFYRISPLSLLKTRIINFFYQGLSITSSILVTLFFLLVEYCINITGT
jgi:hypothetical protein